jgi:hypothetical protein
MCLETVIWNCRMHAPSSWCAVSHLLQGPRLRWMEGRAQLQVLTEGETVAGLNDPSGPTNTPGAANASAVRGSAGGTHVPVATEQHMLTEQHNGPVNRQKDSSISVSHAALTSSEWMPPA